MTNEYLNAFKEKSILKLFEEIQSSPILEKLANKIYTKLFKSFK